MTSPYKIVINIDKNIFSRSYEEENKEEIGELEQILEFKRLIIEEGCKFINKNKTTMK